MPKTWTHRKPCRFCNSRHVLPALKFSFTPPATSFIRSDGSTDVDEKIPLILSLCDKCKLFQMQDVVEPTLMFRNYLHRRVGGADEEARLETYAEEAASRAHLKKGDLVVDIGAGDGALLAIFKKMGMNTVGIDPCPASAEAMKKRGITHYQEFFSPNLANDIRNDHGPASLITANDVLGSIDNLHAVAAGVRFLMKQEGLFFFEEPYLADLLEWNRFDLVSHDRLSLLTATPLEPFFRATLMHFIDARRHHYRHGTLRGIVQRSDGPHVAAPTVAALIEEEKKTNLHTMETMNAFAARVEQLKAAIQKMVGELRSKGRRVAGYGASAGAVTFIHECGWAENVIEYVVDDQPAKQGLRMPGTDIPVVSAKALQEKKPDAVILFAFNHAESIMKQHEAYLRSGGKCIIPFPMPNITG